MNQITSSAKFDQIKRWRGFCATGRLSRSPADSGKSKLSNFAVLNKSSVCRRVSGVIDEMRANLFNTVCVSEMKHVSSPAAACC